MKYLAENVKNPDNNKTISIYEWSTDLEAP